MKVVKNISFSGRTNNKKSLTRFGYQIWLWPISLILIKCIVHSKGSCQCQVDKNDDAKPHHYDVTAWGQQTLKWWFMTELWWWWWWWRSHHFEYKSKLDLPQAWHHQTLKWLILKDLWWWWRPTSFWILNNDDDDARRHWKKMTSSWRLSHYR